MQEKAHVIEVLKKTIKALKKEDVIALKELSNQTIHSSSIAQDPDDILIAVVIYALSKITERKKYTRYKNWSKFHEEYMTHLKKALIDLQKDKIKAYRKEMQEIKEDINRLSGNLKSYIKDVFKKAEINRASRIYEHGISMKKTAKILGITIWELAEYAGQTGISDVDLGLTLPVKQRIEQAEKIFE